MKHRLSPLLNPRSVAVLGASEREHSVGRRTVHNLLAGQFPGTIYPVNPGREQVLGLDCYPDLASLPETVDHVVFAIHDRHIEPAIQATIKHGARAVTIMSQLVLAEDPGLADRIEKQLVDAGILVCGPNGMGFYNCQDGVWMCGFDTRENHRRGGNVTLISHSGAGMSGMLDCEERIDFNLAVSTGQELNVGMADYMDYALEQHQPRVIGLFMETARDPAALVAVLEKANRKQVPVVALKVGRTDLSARLAQSHSGAIAGTDAAFQALFDRYGVQRVRDMDEWITTLILFAQPHPVGPGGLVTIHDSGGERQLLIDLADETGTELASLQDRTIRTLESRLDPGLPAVNPLDAWGAGGPDSDEIMQDCLAAMMADPGAAIGAVVHDRGPGSQIYPEYVDYMKAGHQASGKPAFLVSNRQGSGSDPLVVETTRRGFPVVDGLRSFLVGVNCLFGYRDFLARKPVRAATVNAGTAHSLLAYGDLDEAGASALLSDLGLPMNPCRRVSSEAGALVSAEELGYPVVLKTAVAGIQHKTEQHGVHLGLHTPAAVRAAWNDLNQRLGPDAMVAPMVNEPGLEMMLGMVRDEQFGPLIVMGFGGTRLEAERDVVFALPPFDAATARRLLGQLRQKALLGFDRGHGVPDLDAYCSAAAQFSAAVHALESVLWEADINPVIVHAKGCVGVDALLVGTGTTEQKSIPRKAS